MNKGRKLWRWLLVLLAGTALPMLAATAWLFAESHLDRDEWLNDRQGEVQSISREPLPARRGQVMERVVVRSNTGLEISLRVLRPTGGSDLPLLLLLGGHRTGSEAVALLSGPGTRAVVAFDYPYHGPELRGGLLANLSAIPAVRRCFLDIAPAISSALDWLETEDWAGDDVTMIGVSLGVPFATTAASRDTRIDRLMLVHGAADNRAWIRQNIEQRLPFAALAAHLLDWAAYGPLHDTAANVATLSPRPVLVVGARDDERVPEGQAEALFDAAREPRALRFTDGRHVGPGRRDIIASIEELYDSGWPPTRQ